MDAEKKKILLVEESPVQTHLFQETFKRYAAGEFDLIYQKAFAEALKMLAGERIDLVLLDLSINESQGLEALARFQEADSTTPIVALTGFSKGEMTLRVPRWAPVILSPKNMFRGAELVKALRYYTE